MVTTGPVAVVAEGGSEEAQRRLSGGPNTARLLMASVAVGCAGEAAGGLRARTEQSYITMKRPENCISRIPGEAAHKHIFKPFRRTLSVRVTQRSASGVKAPAPVLMQPVENVAADRMDYGKREEKTKKRTRWKRPISGGVWLPTARYVQRICLPTFEFWRMT